MATEAQRLISVSLTKIAASRQQRGGISLHRNLLVASVLYKARALLIMESNKNGYHRQQSGVVQKSSCSLQSQQQLTQQPTSTVNDDAVVPNDNDECMEDADDETSVDDEETAVMKKSDAQSDSYLPTVLLTMEDETSNSQTSNDLTTSTLHRQQQNGPVLQQTTFTDDHNELNSGHCAQKRRSCELLQTEEPECKRMKTEQDDHSREQVPIVSLVNCFNSSFVGLLQQASGEESSSCEGLVNNACASEVKKDNSFEQRSVPIIALLV